MWEERKKEFNLRASAIVAFEDVELWGVAGKMRASSSTSVVRSGFPGIRKTNDWSGGQEGRGEHQSEGGENGGEEKSERAKGSGCYIDVPQTTKPCQIRGERNHARSRGGYQLDQRHPHRFTGPR